MNCPECKSTKIQKNGHKRGKQNYRCVQCGRQFMTNSDRIIFKSYLNSATPKI